MSEQWVTRWRLEVSAKPVLPGIYKVRGGGFVASAQVPIDRPPPGCRPKYRTIFSVRRNAVTAKDAYDWLEREKRKVLDALFDPFEKQIPRWIDFAVFVLERKVAAGDLQSASGVERWKRALAAILRNAPWATMRLDEVRHAHLLDWRDMLATISWKVEKPGANGELTIIRSGEKYNPRTLNGWLNMASVIWKLAAARFELPKNPFEGITYYSTKTVKTYSVEQPNSLHPTKELPEFLPRLKARFPRWYAFTLLGFVLGQRPSTLRPLRRRGANADIDLVKKKLYIRRSHTIGEHVMNTTKTAVELELAIPDELVDVLKEHINMIDASPVGAKTDLLFPSPFTGKLLSTGCLTRPWREIAKEMGLTKRISPRAMRRTFQDLADGVQIRAVTAMAVSGQKSLKMKHLYSTAHEDEVRDGIAKVIDLATARRKASGEEKS